MTNRHKPMIGTSKMMDVKDLAARGTACAWAGCAASFRGQMPEDWRWMLVYWWPHPAGNHKLAKIAMSRSCDRDAALCPDHALYLESQLKPLMRVADMDPAGVA